MSGIAISGKAGSGKTTLAGQLLAACCDQNIPAIRIAFGDALKAEVLEQHGITKDMVGGREALIRHGEACRRIDPLYWVRPVAERARLAKAAGLLVIVDDMRFVSEFYWAHWAGFVTVRMVADREWRRAKLIQQGLDASVVDSNSPTETDLDDFDFQYKLRNHAGAKLAEAAVYLLGELRD